MPTSTLNKPVFLISSGIIVALALFGVRLPEDAARIFSSALTFVLETFGWLYLLAVGVFVFVVLFLTISRYGQLKLGPDDAEPDYSYLSWLAMLSPRAWASA